MKITVSNFGVIENAEMQIGGLTVITGQNDTGKSTVGKILFSLVKAFARYKEDLEENKEVRIMRYLDEIYFTLRRYINVVQEDELRDFFQPRRLYNQIRLEYRLAKEHAFQLLSIAEKRGTDVPPFIYELINKNLVSIEYVLNEPDDKKQAIQRAIKKAFYSEFKNEILQQGSGVDQPAIISIKDGVTQIVDISLQSDGTIKYQAHDELGFSDATYVDSPAIIQFNNLVRTSKTLFDDSGSSKLSVPLHLKDLSAKLCDSIYSFIGFEMFSEDAELSALSKNISSLVDGSLDYDSDKKDFVLTRRNMTISSSNIASGIKALGILDLLIKGGATKKNSLLILDEPEVNLHPKWQVTYCDIITSLVRYGVDIIVTTHSPYIVQALKDFSCKKEIKHNFYLANKTDDQLSRFSSITDNVSIAIDLLAEPLHELNKKSVDDFFDDELLNTRGEKR